MAMLGLRGKSLLALLFACALALVPAVIVGWLGIQAVRDHFGLAYARNHTLLNQQKILAPVARELALASRLADSTVTRDWLRDENDPEKRARFFQEAAGYQRDFGDHSYFIAGLNQTFYYNDNTGPIVETARYALDPTKDKDAWYYSSLRSSEDHNINVENNLDLGVSKVWLNVVVHDGDRKLGVVGTGIDLSTFLREFIVSADGVTPMVLNQSGAIQAYPDARRIAFKSVSEQASNDKSAFGLLGSDGDRSAFRQAMVHAYAAPGKPTELSADFEGKPQLLVLSYLPELHWYVVTAIDLQSARVLNLQWLTPALISLGVLLAVLLLGFGYTVERLVLRPLRRLQQTAQAISAGRYDIELPAAGSDEIGELSRAFSVMVDKVRSHTEELENRVAERTRALEEANDEMAATHKKIGDSIDYASLIQRAILPDRQMVQSLGPRHFVLWRPRDVVGGDFYVFRADGENCLMGVVDCAGHGVPGALMTMLARAAIDHAINEVGAHDPAAILARTDVAMRAMLQDTELPRALATNMDAGLVYVDRAAGSLQFAGAKMSLYASDGRKVEEFKGARRALGEKRPGEYTNTVVPMDGRTFYLVTDGLLDQAGGDHGFGFGNRRFAELLVKVAGLSLEQQATAVSRALVEYQGPLPQRDDITILSFRFAPSA